MKRFFITKLEIEKVRHLNNIEIELSNTELKHLIFTGKNGSGKTSVLDALADYLENDRLNWEWRVETSKHSREDMLKRVLLYKKLSGIFDDKQIAEITTHQLENTKRDKTSDEFVEIENILREIPHKQEAKIEVFLNDTWENFYNGYKQGKVLIAYYKCDRTFHGEISEHIEKVSLKRAYSLSENPGNLFVKYLVDLKVTEALTRNGEKQEKAEAISNWFLNFESLLQQIFEDTTLKLDFDEETFKFMICQDGKEPYDFNCMSSGFSAIMDIVLDLIIRMTKSKGRDFNFDIPGIVLIDEIETHLHLELQKKVMNILTNLFPNIQFIVSTHSPFILNSIKNVVIYDLENHTLVKNGLTDVPYEGIIEGYFNVDTLSDTLRNKFEDYKKLVHKSVLTDEDFEKIANLEMFLDEIPDYLALEITTEYQQLKAELAQREDL